MPECQMCGTKHPGEPQECPEVRTGETILDKFEIGPVLGVGGMAAVYQARHRVLRRQVALKILHKRFALDDELAARFVREARETAALGHPAFVQVHDAGTTEDGCAYIEMDRLDGIDLYTLRHHEGRIEALRAARIAVAVLGALEALHARGVIHRDLKSSNVYLNKNPDGTEQVKLLDLGFAKVEDEHNLTSRKQLLGTPFYISPEQYTDPTAVDARADLFSLGIVLFEVITGGWPYTYKSKQDLLAKVVHGQLERHITRRDPELPQWLDAVIARALAHDRQARWPDAAAMRTALEQGLAKPGFFRRLLKPTRP